MTILADEQLVKQYVESGEMRHFDELVNRYVRKVRAMIYPIVLHDADADDLTQEVFLRVSNGLSRFRGEAQFSTWLYRIAMNTTHGFLRRKSRNPVATYEDPPEVEDAMAPDRLAMAGESAVLVDRAMARLSPGLRTAITLVVLNGMSVSEAAHAEGCLTATMYWRIHEARRILKKELERNETHENKSR
jgi:RNA polymerase sigma-70 factor (ECF subfamily)